MAADGLATGEIAKRLEGRPSTVSQWRTRFARKRLEGLQAASGPGKPKKDGGLSHQKSPDQSCEKIQEILMTMMRLTGSYHSSVQYVENCKKTFPSLRF